MVYFFVVWFVDSSISCSSSFDVAMSTRSSTHRRHGTLVPLSSISIPSVSFLGLCLFRPSVLRILLLIALLLVVCYLWCGFLWFFHVWFWFLLWCFRRVFLLCSSVCLWFLPYALHTLLLLTMLCHRLWWRLEMPCRSFSSVLLLCSQVPLGSVCGLLLSYLSCLLLVRLWSKCHFLLSCWWFFHIIFRSCSIV